MEPQRVKACLDTHTVLWSLAGDPQLGKSARRIIASSSRMSLIISDIVLLEVSHLSAKGRIDRSLGLDVLLTKIAKSFRVIPIDPKIAALATSLDLPHGDPFDRVIAATAVHHGVPLLTRDKLLKRSKAIETIW